jgi:hypothetical protein
VVSSSFCRVAAHCTEDITVIERMHHNYDVAETLAMMLQVAAQQRTLLSLQYRYSALFATAPYCNTMLESSSAG